MCSDSSAGSSTGEFTFGDGEDGFNQGSSSVSIAGKVLSHLSADSCCAAAGEAFCGDDAVCLQLLTAEGVIAFGIEFGVCQHAAYGRMLMRLGDQGWKVGAVILWSLPRALGQDELAVHVHHGQPFQPVFPGHRLLCVMMHPAYKEGTHRALSQSGGIHGYRG